MAALPKSSELSSSTCSDEDYSDAAEHRRRREAEEEDRLRASVLLKRIVAVEEESRLIMMRQWSDIMSLVVAMDVYGTDRQRKHEEPDQQEGEEVEMEEERNTVLSEAEAHAMLRRCDEAAAAAAAAAATPSADHRGTNSDGAVPLQAHLLVHTTQQQRQKRKELVTSVVGDMISGIVVEREISVLAQEGRQPRADGTEMRRAVETVAAHFEAFASNVLLHLFQEEAASRHLLRTQARESHQKAVAAVWRQQQQQEETKEELVEDDGNEEEDENEDDEDSRARWSEYVRRWKCEYAQHVRLNRDTTRAALLPSLEHIERGRMHAELWHSTVLSNAALASDRLIATDYAAAQAALWEARDDDLRSVRIEFDAEWQDVVSAHRSRQRLLQLCLDDAAHYEAGGRADTACKEAASLVAIRHMFDNELLMLEHSEACLRRSLDRVERNELTARVEGVADTCRGEYRRLLLRHEGGLRLLLGVAFEESLELQKKEELKRRGDVAEAELLGTRRRELQQLQAQQRSALQWFEADARAQLLSFARSTKSTLDRRREVLHSETTLVASGSEKTVGLEPGSRVIHIKMKIG